MSDLEAIRDYHLNLPAKVRSHTKIVQASEMRAPYLLHLTLEKSPQYTPRIGHRQADSEDRTTPRVTASDTLLGCIVGYSVLTSETLDPRRRPKDYTNGYSIRRLDFDVCLEPDRFLVYDQTATNEHWLVGYDAEHQLYPSTRIGQLYVPEITSITGTEVNQERVRIRLALKEACWVTDKIELPEGYYELEFIWDNHTTYKSKLESLVRITKAQYRGQATALVLSPMGADFSVVNEWVKNNP